MSSASLVPEPVPTDMDHRVILQDVTWKDFELLLLIRGDQPVPRLAYSNGRIELMSPSFSHEYVKTNIARILEAWAIRNEVELEGVGSWLLKDPGIERGIEPDECYILGSSAGREVPDLAIEVIWTHGGLDKLAIYRQLGVREVWIWADGQLAVHVLDGESYRASEASALLPELDVGLVSRFCSLRGQLAAVKGFLAALDEAAAP